MIVLLLRLIRILARICVPPFCFSFRIFLSFPPDFVLLLTQSYRSFVCVLSFVSCVLCTFFVLFRLIPTFFLVADLSVATRFPSSLHFVMKE